jgi:hypothetical protein
MPAFVGIFDDRNFLFLIEMDYIQRTVIVTSFAPFASVQVYNGRHSLPPSVSLENKGFV